MRKYLNRLNLAGTLPELIDKAAEFLKLYIQVGAEIVEFKRIDKPEYPLEALREAVVNAVVHRDYSLEGQTIRIFFYTDRVEVHSPGLLPPGVTLTDLVQMHAPSRPRNVLLAQFMREIPGYMERVGAGIRFMVNEMRELDLPDPEFREQHEFLVIFRNGHLVSPEVASVLSREGVHRVHAQSPDASELYFELVSASGLLDHEQAVAEQKAFLRSQSSDAAITATRQSLLGSFRATEFGFEGTLGGQWKIRRFIFLDSAVRTYRIIYDPRSTLNEQILVSRVLQEGRSSE